MNTTLRSRLRAGPTILFALALLGCEESEPSPLEAWTDGTVAIAAPRLRQADLVQSTFVVDSTEQVSAGGPAKADDPLSYAFQGVYRWKSRAHIGADFASLVSEHEYNSNYGRIESTLHVTMGGAHAATQDAEIQQYVPGFLQLGLVRPILLENYLFIDAGCGFSARGSATHRAWWGLYQARGAPTWGGVSRSSTARPVSGKCNRREGRRTGTVQESGGFVCTALITYDLDTLEVTNIEVISCSTGGGVEL